MSRAPALSSSTTLDERDLSCPTKSITVFPSLSVAAFVVSLTHLRGFLVKQLVFNRSRPSNAHPL
jgi:hypothetical protein